LGGFGSTNAAIGFGGTTTTGNYLSSTEKFNGSIWSTSNTLPTSKSLIGSCGTETSALSIGGYTGAAVATTEK